METAESMHNSGRWLYVAFMCQQAIEKLCKGLFVLFVGDEIPRVHNIRHVLSHFSDRLPQPVTEEHNRLFDTLTGYYLEGRYPEYKQKLSTLLGEAEAKELLKQSKEVFEWLQINKP